jgi:orotidine-5'-phosphate decarboxylase
MFNVHTFGGAEMMRRTVDEVGNVCEREGINRPLIIGVTVLTSADPNTLSEVGIREDIKKQVVALAELAAESGLDGVVASPREVVAIRTAVPQSTFLTITPGIRANLATEDDQKRVTTFGRAIANGSDYVVIGRPITQAADRVAAVEQIIGAVESI